MTNGIKKYRGKSPQAWKTMINQIAKYLPEYRVNYMELYKDGKPLNIDDSLALVPRMEDLRTIRRNQIKDQRYKSHNATRMYQRRMVHGPRAYKAFNYAYVLLGNRVFRANNVKRLHLINVCNDAFTLDFGISCILYKIPTDIQAAAPELHFIYYPNGNLSNRNSNLCQKLSYELIKQSRNNVAQVVAITCEARRIQLPYPLDWFKGMNILKNSIIKKDDTYLFTICDILKEKNLLCEYRAADNSVTHVEIPISLIFIPIASMVGQDISVIKDDCLDAVHKFTQ